MITVADACIALGVSNFQLSGEPTSEKEFKEMFIKIDWDSDGKQVESTDPDDFGVTWSQAKTKYDELVAAEPMRLLRIERDSRITETDWWASSDLTMSTERSDYRKALRDFPASDEAKKAKVDSDGRLTGITWPTKPE
tara:strand:+ start:288 stop:701 length:414 start_codon:yes stop_codon:yes gene_type:complete